MVQPDAPTPPDPRGAVTPGPAWLAEVVAAGRNDTPRVVRVELVQAIWHLADEGRFAEIDMALDGLHVDQLHSLTLNTLLRAPFTFRRMLTRWHAFRDRVAVEIQARGEADMLFGLDEPTPASAPALRDALERARQDLKAIIDRTPIGSAVESAADEAVARIDAALALAAHGPERGETAGGRADG